MPACIRRRCASTSASSSCRPQRSAGNTRLYSQADVERLREIQQLTQEEGINLAGVTRIIELQREIEHMQAELASALSAARRAEAAARIARETARRQEVRAALVRVERGRSFGGSAKGHDTGRGNPNRPSFARRALARGPDQR